jgi:hypothetical protein
MFPAPFIQLPRPPLYVSGLKQTRIAEKTGSKINCKENWVKNQLQETSMAESTADTNNLDRQRRAWQRALQTQTTSIVRGEHGREHCRHKQPQSSEESMAESTADTNNLDRQRRQAWQRALQTQTTSIVRGEHGREHCRHKQPRSSEETSMDGMAESTADTNITEDSGDKHGREHCRHKQAWS